jgi:hypothetical protein
LLENRRFGARNIAADKGGDGPHDHRHGDDNGGENEHALQYRRVKPNAVVDVFAVIVVVAHVVVANGGRINPSAAGNVRFLEHFLEHRGQVDSQSTPPGHLPSQVAMR